MDVRPVVATEETAGAKVTLLEALRAIGLASAKDYPCADDRKYRIVSATCSYCHKEQNVVVPIDDVSLCIWCSATLPEEGQQRT